MTDPKEEREQRVMTFEVVRPAGNPMSHRRGDEEPAAPPTVFARPLSDWHEDDGPVAWWRFPIEEASWIGTPLDLDWPGYHTHWTPHPPIPAPVTTFENAPETLGPCMHCGLGIADHHQSIVEPDEFLCPVAEPKGPARGYHDALLPPYGDSGGQV